MKRIFSFILIGIMFISSYAQKATLSGIVIDEKNQPMGFVSVIVKATTIGTTTNTNGEYAIGNLGAGTYTIVANMMGYLKSEQKVTLLEHEKKEVNFVMKEDVLLLNQVVVVGYGVKEKREVTGSIETIKAKDLTQSSGSGSFEQVMQGRASGVQIITAD